MHTIENWWLLNSNVAISSYIIARTLSWFRAIQYFLCLNSACLADKAIYTNLVVICLNRLGLEPTSFRIRGELASHYTTDAILQLKSYDKKATILPRSANRITTFHLKSLNTTKAWHMTMEIRILYLVMFKEWVNQTCFNKIPTILTW